MLGSPERLSFEQNFGGYVSGSAALRRLVCERADVQMLYYPYDPAYYFYSGLTPSTRLNSLYPWNAYQLPSTLQVLSTGKHLVHVNWSQTIWGYRVSDYAKSLQLFLQDHYVEKPGSNYFSPELAQVCP